MAKKTDPVVATFCKNIERGTLDDAYAALNKRPALANEGRPRKALWLAAKYGHAELVDRLLTLGADREAIGWDGLVCCMPETPMRVAARYGHAVVAKKIAGRGKLDIYNAAAVGDTARVRALLKKDKTLARCGLTGFSCAPFTLHALHFAAFNGHIDIVRALLKAGADPLGRVPEPHLIPPLGLALGAGHTEVARILLERGAKPDCDVETMRAYRLAAEPRQQEQLDLLKSCELDINARNPKTREHAAFICVRHPHFEAFVLLLDNGAALDIQRRNGKSMLHMAASMGLTRFATELLDRGADTKLKDEDGKTAYQLAAARKNQKMAEFLRARGIKQ